jgi:hypothetical protein
MPESSQTRRHNSLGYMHTPQECAAYSQVYLLKSRIVNGGPFCFMYIDATLAYFQAQGAG